MFNLRDSTAPLGHSKIRPYGLAGIGGLFFRPTNSINNSLVGVGNNIGNNQTKAAFVYGGGFDYGLTGTSRCGPNTAAICTRSLTFQIPGLASDNFTHMAQPSIGLVWRF